MEVSAATAPTAAVPGWSAWELKPYMNENRNWQGVSDFWAALVRGDTRLSALGLAEPHEFRMPPEAAAAGGGSTHVGGQGRGSDAGAAAPGACVRAAEDGDSDDAEDAAGESAAGRQRRQLRQDFGPQRTTYKVDIAYQGSEFAGWAFQANRRTVQGTLEAALPALLTGPQYSQARQAAAAAAAAAVDTTADGTPCGRSGRGSAKSGPAAKVVVSSAGRTDAGVSGYGMPISFYAWHELSPANIVATIAAAAPSPGSLRALAVRAVPRQFHATFSASWRRYVYLFPLRRGGDGTNGNGGVAAAAARTGEGAGGCSGVSGVVGGGSGSTASAATAAAGEAGGVAGAMKQPPQPPRPVPPEVWCLDPDVALLQELLAALRGRPLDYLACARDTPPGKDGICTLHVCRASVVELPPLGLSADDAPAWAAASGSKPPQPGVSPGTAAASAILGPGAAAAGAAVAGAAVAGVAAAGPDADAGAGGSGNGLGRGGGEQATAGGDAEGEGAGGCGPIGRAGGGVRVMAVELVGSRFLKRMVRVLVSTALREATPGAARYGGRRDALLQCFAEGRDATGMPAPAAGLCFAGAGYPQELFGADS